MEAAGYGFHHQSEDGRYLIMANGTKAFALPTQPESHIKTAEMSTEQNYNMIDGMMNNAPSMEELEARAKAGEQISLLDVAEAAKAEAKKPKQTRKTTQKQKKPSIRAQLAAAKEKQKKKAPGAGKIKRNGGMRNVFHRGRRKPDLSVPQRRPPQDGGKSPGSFAGHGQGNGGAGLPDRR